MILKDLPPFPPSLFFQVEGFIPHIRDKKKKVFCDFHMGWCDLNMAPPPRLHILRNKNRTIY